MAGLHPDTLVWLSSASDTWWCHCHSLSLASVKSRLVLPFWHRLTWVIPDKLQRAIKWLCVCNISQVMVQMQLAPHKSIKTPRKSLLQRKHTHMHTDTYLHRNVNLSFWPTVLSVEPLVQCVVCLSVVWDVFYCGKRYVLAKNSLKEWIGNQGEKVDFWGRCHISTSGITATATETAVFAFFLPVQPIDWYCPINLILTLSPSLIDF